MKWKKFKKVLAENPWLRDFVGSANVISAPHNNSADKAKSILKQWVRTRVDFIAFRPFENLELDAKNLRSGYGPDHQWERYQVLVHIEGESFAHRARSVCWDGFHPDESVLAVIIGLIAWHNQHWAKKGKKLFFDAVIKEKGNEASRSMEIYRFPENFELAN